MKKTLLSQDFYRDVKQFFEDLSKNEDHWPKFAKLGKNWKIIPWKKAGDGSELYFINIDKLKRLSFHDVKFLIDNMIYLAQEKLQQEEALDKVNFCSLTFAKQKPNKRGIKMLEMKNIKTAPVAKMKIQLKNKWFIKL